MKRKSAPGSSKYRPSKKAKSARVYLPKQRFGEVKGLDTLLTLDPIIATTNDNGSVFVLNLVPPGTGSFNRVGRKIFSRSLRLKGNIIISTSPTATTSDQSAPLVRMVVVWDKQPSSGTVPTWDTIFGYTPQTGTEASTVLAPPRYDNMDRFKVLKDCHFGGQITAVASGGSTNFVVNRYAFDEYMKVKKESVYSGQSSTQTIADISSGALYVYFRSTVNTSTNKAAVGLESIARLRYTD